MSIASDLSHDEQWLPVVGYEGLYEVSSLGRVRGLDRRRSDGRRVKGRNLTPGPHPGGYLLIHLYGPFRSACLHVIVAEAFHGPCPPGHQCRHLDGVKMNCAADNLTWGTPVENAADKIGHGTKTQGETNPGVKLTSVQVAEIRKRLGEPQALLAAEFGCTFQNISKIQTRKSWRHV